MNSSTSASVVGGFSIVDWDIEGPAFDEQLVDVRWLRDHTQSASSESVFGANSTGGCFGLDKSASKGRRTSILDS